MSLPGMGPGRLWRVAVAGDPVTCWHRLRSGEVPPELRPRGDRRVRATAEPSAAWPAEAASIDLGDVHRAHVEAGITVSIVGDAGHPAVESPDPHVPPVLLWRGRQGAVGRRSPAVGVIGTRRATRAGLDIAEELGAGLASAGCDVVSGLALGVDAAAHRGALRSGGGSVTAVVGTGHDVVYPRANRGLWSDLAERGSVCSEYVLGTPPAAWRFPARNRILVALCDAVVVVESHRRGGSLITAGIAGDRGVPVLAVPGSIRSPASEGTNRLIADGCAPCLGVDDVLVAVGLGGARQLTFGDTGDTGAPAAVPVDPVGAEILDQLGVVPRTIDELADACPGVGLGALAVAVAALLADGWVVEHDGRLERLR